MSTPSASDSHHETFASEPFRTIACPVDGTRAGVEAARQAALLAQPGAALRFLAVPWATPTLAPPTVELARRRAAQALERARVIAHDLGVRAEGLIVEGPGAAQKALEEAADDDLLVVGSSGRSRAGGLVLGHPADHILHGAHSSVLLARHAPTRELPESFLVAADQPADARVAAEAAGAIARHRDAVVMVLADARGDAGAHHAAAEAGAALTSMTGVEPVVVDAQGRYHAAAAHVAAELGTSLIVTAGRHAVRIAESAPCSVLVLRVD